MTGAQVRERVPDWFVRKADQIELIDSSPEALRRRMLHGNIYPKDKVPQALTHFFRTDNLIALRELALRFLADEPDEELLEHLRRRRSRSCGRPPNASWSPSPPLPATDVLLRRAARIASRFKGELDVVHVIVGDTGRPGDRQAIDGLRQLTADLGARWHEIQDDDPARAISRLCAAASDHPDRHRLYPAQPEAHHRRRADPTARHPRGGRIRHRRPESSPAAGQLPPRSSTPVLPRNPDLARHTRPRLPRCVAALAVTGFAHAPPTATAADGTASLAPCARTRSTPGRSAAGWSSPT